MDCTSHGAEIHRHKGVDLAKGYFAFCLFAALKKISGTATQRERTQIGRENTSVHNPFTSAGTTNVTPLITPTLSIDREVDREEKVISFTSEVHKPAFTMVIS